MFKPKLQADLLSMLDWFSLNAGLLANEGPIEIRALSGMEQRNIYTRVAGRVCDTAKKVHNFVQQRIVHGRRFHEQQKYAIQT